MYDAGNRRFMAVDAIRGRVIDDWRRMNAKIMYINNNNCDFNYIRL